jgi:hypothetical protein
MATVMPEIQADSTLDQVAHLDKPVLTGELSTSWTNPVDASYFFLSLFGTQMRVHGLGLCRVPRPFSQLSFGSGFHARR